MDARPEPSRATENLVVRIRILVLHPRHLLVLRRGGSVSVADPVASMVSTCFNVLLDAAAFGGVLAACDVVGAIDVCRADLPGQAAESIVLETGCPRDIVVVRHLGIQGWCIRSNAIQLGARLVKREATLSMSSPKVRVMLGARGAFPMAMRRRWVHHVADRDSILARAGLNDGAVETR